MTLEEYRIKYQLSWTQLARQLGFQNLKNPTQEVKRYCEGLAVPRVSRMIKITDNTNGEVTANDFLRTSR
mgnify:CR=1 FL=1